MLTVRASPQAVSQHCLVLAGPHPRELADGPSPREDRASGAVANVRGRARDAVSSNRPEAGLALAAVGPQRSGHRSCLTARPTRLATTAPISRIVFCATANASGEPMRRVPTVLCLTLAAAGLLVHAQEKKDDQQRPPTFRTGAHFVAVDAYPTQDGKAITGLTINDFELLEDGKPQVIDRVDFIEHPEWTPLADRRDPNSQRDGFEMAADPKYRVFVLYLDAWHVDFAGGHRVALPIIDLLNRMMGPQDLFGVMTPYLTIKDLLLGQSTLSIQEQLEKYPYWGIASKNPLPEELRARGRRVRLR